MVAVVPPLLKSLMTRRSPFLWTPVKPVPPPTLLEPRPIAFWKNQKPCWASPLLSKRSEPKYNTSHLTVRSRGGWPVPPVPFGHVPLGAVPSSVNRAAKLWTRLSLSGNPPAPSFHAHPLISPGSFDP